MTTAFPCNECQTLIGESCHPDRWLCPMCLRPAEQVSPEQRAFAIEENTLLSEIPVEDVLQALKKMAEDKRITNEPVKAIFKRAYDLLTTQHHETSNEPYRFTLEEGQASHRRSMMEAGIDPTGEQGMMLRGSFLAGWEIARARGPQ